MTLLCIANDRDQHVKQLCKFLCHLREIKVKVNLVKTEFCHACVEFLGHVVGQGWIPPEWKLLQNIQFLRISTSLHKMVEYC